MRCSPVLLSFLALSLGCDSRFYALGTAPDGGADSGPSTGNGGSGLATGGVGGMAGVGEATGGAGGTAGRGETGGSGGGAGQGGDTGSGGSAGSSFGAGGGPAMEVCEGATDAIAAVTTLGPKELAERLARFVWNQPASADLVAAVIPLRTSVQVQKLAQSMMADPRWTGGIDALGQAWLGLDPIGAAGAPEVGPVDAALRASMAGESQAFWRDLFLGQGDGRLDTLLLASYTFADPAVAKLYGVGLAGGAGFTRVMTDPARRSGLLTQPALMFVAPTITRRGVWLDRTFLCEQIPSAPPDAPSSAEPLPGETRRQTLERATAGAVCQACHQLVDPPGFALEHYDGLGRWRDDDGGKPLDTQGWLQTPATQAYKFSGARELGRALAGSCEVQHCVARSFLEHALGAPLRENQNDSAETLARIFVSGQRDLRLLFAAAAGTRAFVSP
jgi:hypothetical protein